MKPTDDDLKRDAATDLAACSKATPGPWFVNPRTGHICHGDPADDRDNYPIDDPADDEFIALARTALPAWIRRAQAAEAEVARLRADSKGGDL
jgi:hypothetical protein